MDTLTWIFMPKQAVYCIYLCQDGAFLDNSLILLDIEKLLVLFSSHEIFHAHCLWHNVNILFLKQP